MDETPFIQAAKRGDVESFNRLVLSYQDMVFNVAYRIMGDRDAAADAAQEAFISAFRNLHQFQGERFKSWLMRIVTNACYDELRRRQRRPASSLENLYEVTDQVDFPAASHEDSPEQIAQQHELNDAIQDCISALPENQRVIVVLVDVEGYSYQDIVSIVGAPLGTVKSRLSRARTQLRDCLQAVQELLPAQYRLSNERES